MARSASGRVYRVMNSARRPALKQRIALLRRKSWRLSLVSLVAKWSRSQIWWLLLAIIVVWLLAALLLHVIEPAGNPAFATWGAALWNVWVILFSGITEVPHSVGGRLVASGLVVWGIAFSGLFTAGVASILIDRMLRRRQVTSVEMSDHLVLCNWAPRGLDWIRDVHSNIVAQRRPIVIIHDNPEDIELPDKQDDPAFNDVYIVKGDPTNEVILRRAKVPQAYSVVILADERHGQHADGKSIVCCIAVKNVCRSEALPNIVVECLDPKFRGHMRKAGADEVISAAQFGLRLLARASLFHGMTRVYQELLTVARDANEMYLISIPQTLIGKNFVEVSNIFLAERDKKNACLLIGIYRGEKMMLNPVGDEAGPLRDGDELILLSPALPDLSRLVGGSTDKV